MASRTARLLAAAALAAVLPLSACGGTSTSYSSRCSGGVCTVNLTGEQAFEVDGTDGVERDLGVGPIEPGAVTLSVDDTTRLEVGRSARLDGVPVEVVSVAGRDVTLRIGATEVESSDGDTDASSGSRKAAKATSTKSTSTKSTSTKSTSTKSAKSTSTRSR